MTAAKASATPRKRRSPTRKGVSLTRTTPKVRQPLRTDYTPFIRALRNFGHAAEVATTVDRSGKEVPSIPARAFYSARRDALLETL